MESEIDTVHLQSSHSREQPKIHGCLSPLIITEPTASPLDRPISFNVLSSRDPVEQAIRGGDRGAAAIINPLSTAVIQFLPEQPQNQDASVSDEEEWEILRIVDKRWTENGYEYQVCWEKTWLLESELGNAQQLLQQFEAKHHAQRGGKRERPVCTDKNRWALATFTEETEMLLIVSTVIDSQFSNKLISLSFFFLTLLMPPLSQESSARMFSSSLKGDKFHVGSRGFTSRPPVVMTFWMDEGSFLWMISPLMPAFTSFAVAWWSIWGERLCQVDLLGLHYFKTQSLWTELIC